MEAARPARGMAARTAVFSYGSNGTAQLRARVQNEALYSRPAKVENFARIFCLRSRGWGGGGVASLHPCPGTTTYGAVVELTEAELGRLDRFEGGYSRQIIEAKVQAADGQEETAEAVVYISDNSEMTAPPTEQYLTAIHLMLREHWSMDGETIEVRSANGSMGVRVESSWRHPGCTKLTLAALVVEVNALRSSPWKMPATIGEIETKLAAVGVVDSDDLAEALTAAEGASALNAALVAAGHRPFGSETLRILGELLELLPADAKPSGMDELEAAMAAMEDGRAAFEVAAQCVRRALEVVEAAADEASANLSLPKTELARAERKRRRLPAAAAGSSRGTAAPAAPDDGPAVRAFEDAAAETAARLHTALRTMARLQDQTRDVRVAVEATKACATPLLAPARQANAVEARNEGCSELLWVLGQVGPISEAVFSSFSLVQLCRAGRGCRAFRRWTWEARERLPRLLAVGGQVERQGIWVPVAAAEVLSLATMGWVSGGGAPPPLPLPRQPLLSPVRTSHSKAWMQAACASATGIVTVVGGLNASSEQAEQDQQIRQALQWSPATGEWESLPDMGEGRTGSCAVQLLDGRTMVAGGISATGSWPRGLSSVEALAADGSGWSTLAPMGTGRFDHVIGLLPIGHVIVAGGTSGTGSLSSAEMWNPATSSWSALPPMAHARSAAAGCVLPSGRFAVLGGGSADQDGEDRSDGEVYDPVRRVWEPLPAEMAVSRYGSFAAPVPGGLIVAGGNNDDAIDSAELYEEASGRWFRLPHRKPDKAVSFSLVNLSAS